MCCPGDDPGADGYLLKQVIHDYGDDLAIQILKNCRTAMNEDGCILIIETIIDPGAPDHVTGFFDLHMLVTAPGGRERTEDEFRDLLRQAGLRILKITHTPVSFSIVEAIPIT